ncbi:hypothetical protein ACOME3_003252 [Neoechinorhynchus agilis]
MIAVLLALTSASASAQMLLYGEPLLALSSEQVTYLWNVSLIMKSAGYPTALDSIPLRTVSVEIGSKFTLKPSQAIVDKMLLLINKGLDSHVVWFRWPFEGDSGGRIIVSYDYSINTYKSCSVGIETDSNGSLIVDTKTTINHSAYYFVIGLQLKKSGFNDLLKKYYVNFYRRIANSICDGETFIQLDYNQTVKPRCGIEYSTKAMFDFVGLKTYTPCPSIEISPFKYEGTNIDDCNLVKTIIKPITIYNEGRDVTCRVNFFESIPYGNDQHNENFSLKRKTLIN